MYNVYFAWIKSRLGARPTVSDSKIALVVAPSRTTSLSRYHWYRNHGTILEKWYHQCAGYLNEVPPYGKVA